MKTFILTFCTICLCYCGVGSQVIYERTYPYASNSLEHTIELSDTSTFSFDNEDVCNGIIARHIDKFGIELTDNTFYEVGFSSGFHWIGHDSVLIWVEHGAHDVGPDSLYVYLWTPESTFKLLSSNVSYDFSPDRRFGAFLYSPERLIYEKGDTLYSYNVLTATTEEFIILEGIYSIKEFEKTILVMSDADDPLLLNNHLEEINEWNHNWTLPFSLEDALVLDRYLVGLDSLQPLSIVAVNVYNESQQVLDLSSFLDQIEEIQSNQHWLFVKGNANGENIVLQINADLQVADIKALEIPGLDKEFSYRYYPDRVYAWSTDGLANYEANYRICYPYEAPSPIKYVDIALDTMWVDSIVYPPPVHDYIFIYMEAVVSNHSNDTIDFFSMHHFDIPFWCYDGLYVGTFEERNIAPNSTDTVRLQFWALQYGMFFNRRIYVHHGNHQLDSISSNNSFLVNHLLSSSEEIVHSSLNVFPNPFRNAIYIQDLPETARLSLFNQTGQLMASDNNQLSDLGFLPPGIYFLQIADGQSIRTTRVIKAE